MADDLPRIRGNVEKMIGAGAPAHDIDDYLASEGHTPDSFRTLAKGGAEPSLGRQAWDAVNTGVNWLGTRAVKAGAGLVDLAPDTAGPAIAARAARSPDAPKPKEIGSGGDIIKNVFFDRLGAPEVNAPGEGGKMLDAATEAVIGVTALPGTIARKVIPAAIGGATSELAGQQTAGTPYEIPARIIAGVGAGGIAAGAQEGFRAGVRGVRNALGLKRDVDETAGRVIGRNVTRDNDTPNALLGRANAAGPGATLLDVAGENVRGAVRGAIAPPGPARNTFKKNIDERGEGEVDRLSASVSKNISPKGMVQTVDDLVDARTKASGPAYEAAGVPRDPKAYATAPVLEGEAVKALIADSADIRRAITAAKRLPDYKSLPDTSMVLLDKAYKNIGGMAEEARRAGNGERYRDLNGLRQSLAAAIDAENPNYGVALKTYSEPSKLKDAAELGAKMFSGNKDPELVRREFARLSDDAKDAFRVGAADQYRKTLGNSDATNAAGRIAKGDAGRERLTAILGKEEADAILGDVARERMFTRTARLKGGSDSVPKGLEASDNARAAGGVVSALARGEPVNAFMQGIRSVGARVGQGQTEAVNARIVEILTSVKPEDRTAFAAALEQALMRQRLTAPRNAFRAGAGASLPAATQERR